MAPPSQRVVIDPRFCGPPDCGNGGYVAGLLAAPLGAASEVRLRAPAPLDEPLEVRVGAEGGRELWHGEQLLATARLAPLELAAPEPPPFAEAERRAGSCRAFKTHPFPRCFVCGPDRAEGDGLRILPGWFEERQLAAAPWCPAANLSRDGQVAAEFVWAALDSPSAFPLLEPPESVRHEPMVLGALTVDLRQPVAAGEPSTVRRR